MKREMLAIGGSAGSLEFIIRTLPLFWTSLGIAVIIVLHRKSNGDSTLTNLLATRTSLVVKEVEEKESILPGVIYIAPPDYHVLIEKDYTFSLDYSEKVNYSRPSIDITFESAADVYGQRLACLLLSGSNADGVAGMKAVKAGRRPYRSSGSCHQRNAVYAATRPRRSSGGLYSERRQRTRVFGSLLLHGERQF